MMIESPRNVFITTADFRTFAASWPCSGMRFEDDICCSVEFAGNGDLVDISWYNCTNIRSVIHPFDISEPEGIDGGALLAIVADAQKYMAENIADCAWIERESCGGRLYGTGL
jgi:hypothetical protein